MKNSPLTPSWRVTMVISAALICVTSMLQAADAASTSGLAAHYYEDKAYWDGNWPDATPVPAVLPAAWTFTRYAYTRVEPLINHLFIQDGWFTVRWQGSLDTDPGHPESNESHEYTFTVWADDGCRLTIGETTLIDSWVPCSEFSPESRRNVSVRLTRGKHHIVLEYFQGQSLARDDADPSKLYWSCDERGIPEQVIPASHLSHDLADLVPESGRDD